MFFSPKGPDRFWGPPSPLLNGLWGSLLGVKRSEREVDHHLLLVPRLRMSGDTLPSLLYVLMAKRVRKHNLQTTGNGIAWDSVRWQ